jgi:large subunit ribosomal protein L25
MEQVTLRAEVGRTTGTRESRRLRRAGQIPAVVYGHGLDSVTVAVDRRSLHGALHTEAGLNALINLQVEGNEYLTVAREVQRHPFRGDIIHLDFIQISLDEVIEAEVHVEFVGVPVGVREHHGIVETVHSSVVLSALPTAIPSHITFDISAMGINDSVHVADLPELPGVTYLTDPTQIMMMVAMPAAAVAEVGAEGAVAAAATVGEEAEEEA